MAGVIAELYSFIEVWSIRLLLGRPLFFQKALGQHGGRLPWETESAAQITPGLTHFWRNPGLYRTPLTGIRESYPSGPGNTSCEGSIAAFRRYTHYSYEV